MPHFDVNYVLTITGTLTVEADSAEAAKEQVKTNASITDLVEQGDVGEVRVPQTPTESKPGT
jgi:hypothetical protein